MATVVEQPTAQDPIMVPHVVRGRLETGAAVEHRSRATGRVVLTPALNLNDLVWPRREPVPAQELPIAEVLDFLAEVGRQLELDRNPHLREALQLMAEFNPLGPRVLENCYRDLTRIFLRDGLEREVETLGGARFLDGWQRVEFGPRAVRVRAFPPRIAHILAGNAPVVAALTVVRSALTKGVHLLKMPSNDMFTASAILRTMADVDPDHPTTRSFTAVYWRGGDTSIESALFRSQYFDKLVVWGGESAVRHALAYVGPGFELISFDPKVSISIVGREAFASEQTLAEAAQAGAADSAGFDQDACSSSRFHFVEGTVEEVDRYCAALAAAMGDDTLFGNGIGPVPPADVRETVEVYRSLEPAYRVFGGFDGRGVVVRSLEPVDFHPSGKLVNVVRLERLQDAMSFVTVATQTVGIYPFARVAELRDELANAGAQRLFPLGEVHSPQPYGGTPHDAMWPTSRFLKWIWQVETEETA